MRDLFKYTPALESAETLQQVSVGREQQLHRILKALKEATHSRGHKHFMLVGPRGIGKTHLLLLVYHSVMGTIDSPDIDETVRSSWIPIVFAEEEYGITSLLDLLIAVLTRLAERNGDARIHTLLQRVNSVHPPGEKELEAVLEFFQGRQEEDARYLLLIDNAQGSLGSFTEEDQGRLRNVLMSEDTFMIIGAAPTLFESVMDYQAPFYNFFEIVWLQDLDENQVKELISKRLRLDGRDELLPKLSESEGRLKAIVHLTGGNPRLILSLYTMFAESKILETERDFVRLLDEMTPYFQDRMNALSAQQKKVLDALAMMDGPSTPTEIAHFARLPIAIVNSQLNRLKQSRFIAAAKQKGKKQALYDITERLFRFWRQMRVEAGRKRVRFLIKFIEIWYTEEELISEIEQTFHTLTNSVEIDRMGACKEAAERLFYIREAGPPIVRAIAHFERVFLLAMSGDFSTATAEAEALRAEALAESDDEVLAQALLEISNVEYLQGNTQRATETLDQFEEVQCDNPAFWFVAGSLYSMVGEREKAASWLEKAKKAMPDDPDVNYALGQVLMTVEAYEDATMMLEKAVKTKPDDPRFLLSLGLAYRRNDMPDKARESFKKVLKLDSGMSWAWMNLGMVLHGEGSYNEAIDAFSQAIDLEKEPTRALAVSLILRGITYGRSGKNTLAYADEKRAFAISQDGNWSEELQLAARATLLSGLALSEWSVVRRYYDRAFLYLHEILKYVLPAILQDSLSLIGSYFKLLLKTRDLEIVKRALRVVEESDKPDLVEFVKPYQIAIEYLDTGDEAILNRVPSEIRDIVEEIASKLE